MGDYMTGPKTRRVDYVTTIARMHGFNYLRACGTERNTVIGFFPANSTGPGRREWSVTLLRSLDCA